MKPPPDASALRAVVAGDRFGVAGVHLFTFNQVARTAQWRDRMLHELGGFP